MSQPFKSNLYITVFDAENPPYEVQLSSFSKDVISFGRQKDCDIVLNSEYASRIHGCIYADGHRCMVRDLDSTNGIICAGRKVKEARLRDGDYIRIVSGNRNTEHGVLLVFSIKESEEVWNTFSLSGKNRITIGRSDDNDICLEHISVSHRHALIVKTDIGYYLVNNHSTNGVLVNGKSVAGKHLLKDQDLILITNTKLIFTKSKITYSCAKVGIGVEAVHVVKKVGKHKELTICDDVSLSIRPGELVAIVGGSGAGKSTIMNCISGYSMPTGGQVLVNGVDLYDNFNAMKHIIGYVPQQDIVYDNLTVYEMLKYSARLRLPRDIGAEETDQIVNRVIDTVELTHRKDELVRNLSGGQRKRASIAVELLTDPNLFFLDEPASGLDPGTERSLIRTLRGMTASGKTVILVTHSTLNLEDYDRIIFMGTGGKLCFCGNYQEALDFFHTRDIVDVYELIGKSAKAWQKRYMNSRMTNETTHTKRMKKPSVSSDRRGGWRQFAVLCQRYIKLLLHDRQRMLLLLLQAPLLAVLISIVANGKEFHQYEMTKSLLFALSCSAFWIGILSSIQEICKERHILKREYMTGLNLTSYILSKIAVLSLLCFIQSLLIVTTFTLLIGTPDEGVWTDPYFELLLTTLVTSMAAASMGIFVSSLFSNADRAMTVAPILLMPQILFSGLIFTLKDAAEVISYFAVCRYSMEGYGTTANLNSLKLKMQEEGFPIKHEAEDFFEYTTAHLLQSWGILLLFVVFFAVGAGLVLRNIRKNK